MGSYKHIFVGIVLVGTTFVFARFLHNGGLSIDDANTPLIQNDVADTTSSTTSQTTETSQTPSLKERILRRQSGNSKRESIQNNEETLSLSATDQNLPASPKVDARTAALPSSDNSNVDPINPIEAIVLPDFSHLEATILKSDSLPFVAQSDPPKLLKIPDAPTPQLPEINAEKGPTSFSNSLANEIPLPPSHDITPIHISPPGKSFPRQGKQTVKKATGIPFGLTQKARSELVAVHKRSDQVKPATTNFLDHIAKEGDTLQSLSDQYYGRPDFYLDIYLANQDKLRNPSSIPAGTTIKIPIFQD